MTDKSASALPAEESAHKHQPSGREEIMEAIVAASTTLFAERGPARVTVRDIASRAGVPHSVVFRYFGDKQNVLLEVLRRGSEQEQRIFDNEWPSPEERFEAEMENRAYRMAVLQAMLDGMSPSEIPGGMPELRKTLELLQTLGSTRAPKEPSFEPKAVAAFIVAAMIGWDVTESFYMDALDIPSEKLPAIRSQVAGMIEILMGHVHS